MILRSTADAPIAHELPIIRACEPRTMILCQMPIGFDYCIVAPSKRIGSSHAPSLDHGVDALSRRSMVRNAKEGHIRARPLSAKGASTRLPLPAL